MSEAKIKLAVDGVGSVVSGLGRVEEKADALGKTFGALSAIGGTLSVGTFTAMVKSSIDAADRLGDLSVATNITVEDLSGLDWAAQLSGTNLDDVAKAVNRLAVEMGKDADKFAKIGVTAKDPLEAFKQMADVLNRIEDPQKRAAVANAVFGKSWETLAPLLAEGGTKIGEMVERGKELSGVTTEMSQEAGKFNDQLDEMKKLAGQIGINLAKEMLPAMNDVLGAVKEAYTESGKLNAVWVAMGGLGAFLFTDEFASAQSKLKSLREELDDLESEQKQVEAAPLAGIVPRLLFGKDLDKEIAEKKAQIDGLLKALEKPVTPPKEEKKPDGTPPDTNAFLGGKNDRDAAIKRSNEFIAAMKKEAAEIGATTEEKKRYEAEQIAGTLRLAGASDAYILKFLNNSLREAEALEEKKRAFESDEEIKKSMLKATEDLIGAGAKQIESIQEQLQAERQHNAEIGLTAVQLADLTAHRIEDEAATDRQTAAAIRAAAAFAGPLHDAYLQYADDLEKAAAAKDALADEKRIGGARQKFFEEEKKTAEESKKVWEDFSSNVQRNVGDVLYDGMQGRFDGIADGFAAMLQRMIADALAADLSAAIFNGGKGGGNMDRLASGVGGFLGSMFGGSYDSWSSANSGWAASNGVSLDDLAMSFDGGGYTGAGSRSGGIDGKGGFHAILHPQETVIDHTKGQSVGSNVSVQVNNYTTAKASVKESLDSRGNRRIDVTIAEMVAGEMRRPGSAAHSAVQSTFGARPALVGR